MPSLNPKILICCFFLQIGLGVVFAQSVEKKKIDSLKFILKENPKRYLVKYDLAERYTETDSVLAFQIIDEALTIAKQRGEQYGIAKGEFTKAGIYFDYNKRDVAKYHYQAADSILSNLMKQDSSDRVLRLWVRSNFNIGVILSYEGSPNQIKYLEKITPIAEKIEFYDILSAANTNMAIEFYNAEQYTKSYEYFLKSEDLYNKSESYDDYLVDRLIFTSCLLELDSLRAAKKQINNLDKLLENSTDISKLQLHQMILGQYYRKNEEYEKAVESLKNAEQYLESTLVVNNDLQLYLDFMLTYGEMGNFKEARNYAKKCLTLGKKANNQVVMADVYKKLAQYEKRMGYTEKAYEALKSYVKISDTMNLKELEKEINRLETKYQSEKKEREILQLKSDNDNVALQLAKKQSQNYLLLSVSMGLLVLASLTFFGYRNFRKRDQIKTAQINKLKHEQESKVYNAMLDGQENERKRLAIDLHDGLAGRLSATRIKLEKLAQKSKNDKAENEFKQAAKNIDDSLTELRGIAMNLMPETLFKYGLKNAIEDYCSSISSGLDDVKFILQFYDTEKVLSDNISLTIYRIIQELINNAIKHSKASEVLVQYLIDNDTINITVEDNGKGFSSEILKEKKGMGLNNLKTRVAYLNGEMEFDSTPNEGTTVHIVINI
jgi:signal transduction histidine kinase